MNAGGVTIVRYGSLEFLEAQSLQLARPEHAPTLLNFALESFLLKGAVEVCSQGNAEHTPAPRGGSHGDDILDIQVMVRHEAVARQLTPTPIGSMTLPKGTLQHNGSKHLHTCTSYATSSPGGSLACGDRHPSWPSLHEA